jgi:uncharacterized protein (TIGR04255 family)
MGRKMTRAPVFVVIVQTRFNAILALESYVPVIQDKLRLQGFPDTQRSVLATFNLNVANVGAAGQPQVPVSQVARYTFSNIERTAGFTLDQSALSFQTTNYDVFETFSAQFLNGLRTVHESVGLGYTDRIGLRYLDAVCPEAGEDLTRYLNPAVLGLYGKLEGDLSHAFSETMIKRGTTSVVARTIIHVGEIGVPADLQPFTLTIAERFRSLRGLHAILDNDVAQEQRDAFDLKLIETRLSAVHLAVTEAFRATITQDALRRWE